MNKITIIVCMCVLQCAHVAMATEDGIRHYLNENKNLHPVEGIWQSTDGFKYGITSSYRNGKKAYSMEILASSTKAFRVGEFKGYIVTEGNDKIYSLEYIVRNELAYDPNFFERAKGWVKEEMIRERMNGGKIQNLILIQESPTLMTFQKLDGEIISLCKLYPNNTSFQSKNAPSSAGKSSGTGFFVGPNGYIITNYHVVDGARNIKVTKVNGDNYKKYSAKVEVSDKQNDLAIIKITDSSFSSISALPYSFKFTAANVGEDCFVLGYPLVSTMGTEIKLTNGIISSRTGFNGNVSEYQMSAPVQPGNSGGPLFDKDGNVIGVVCAKHSGAENAGYAIKASYIRNLVELLPQTIAFPQINKLIGKTLPKQVELASKAVCLIIVNDD